MDVKSLLLFWGVPSAVTGFFFWLFQRRILKRDKKREELEKKRRQEQEEREKAREKSQILLIRGINAAIGLSEAIAIAVKNGQCNGEIESALDYTQEVKFEQRDFLTEQGVKHLS